MSITSPSISIEIEHLDLVGIWSYDVANQKCQICKIILTEPCPDCVTHSKNIIDEKCKISKGKCQHAFHYHCINGWLKTSDTCPTDRSPWNYEKEDIDNIKRRKLIKKKKYTKSNELD